MSNIGIATYREMSICDQFATERRRAHEKHRDTSMEQADVLSDVRVSILTEELGEIARALNEIRHNSGRDEITEGEREMRERELIADLDRELTQLGAMALTWRANLAGERLEAVAR